MCSVSLKLITDTSVTQDVQTWGERVCVCVCRPGEVRVDLKTCQTVVTECE